MIKNRCIAWATELFFEEVLVKKNEFIWVFYNEYWYKITAK